MNLSDITKPLTPDQIVTLTMDQARARLKLISEAASRGDYSWSYDEYVLIGNRLPEELAARKKALAAVKRRVTRRQNGF